MSFKPSRSSGITYEKHRMKADRYRDELATLLPECNPPKFEDINRLSKCFYLYWLNDNRASQTFGHSREYPFNTYCNAYFIMVFKRNLEYVYKPAREIILSN